MDYQSSDSDRELHRSQRRKHNQRVKSPKRVSSKVDRLASTLQDTNQNLRVVDRMLEEYQQLGEQQTNVMDRLKDDLARTSAHLREERLKRSTRDTGQPLRASDLEDDGMHDRRSFRAPTSPLRDYESDRDYGNRGRGRSRTSVRFFDDMDARNHIHSLHQTVRDLASEQLRLEDDFSREINRRHRSDSESRRLFRPTSDVQAPEVATAISSVDKRLQSIQDELRSEREVLRKKQDEVGKISSELKEALQHQKSASLKPDFDFKPTQPVIEAHSAHKGQMEAELEIVRRRLDQSEGGRDALVDQIDELRRQLISSDKEKARLHVLMQQQEEDVREKRRRQAYDDHGNEQILSDNRRMEEELRELRSQLNKSAAIIGDYGAVQKELDRSEKQRTQLSDHIQVLNKDLENKEKQNAKLLIQLREMADKYEDCDRQRHDLLLQLEDVLKKLRDTTKQAEAFAADLKDTQHLFQESEQKREEVKARAQETVRQWKVKCKKLERDVDRHKHSQQQVTERNEQLIKEVEASRNQINTGSGQLEQFKREMNELLATRVQQDEQIRIKDVEVNELKSLKMDLEREIRDCKMVIERLEHELHGSNDKQHRMYEEKSMLEEEVSGLSAAQAMGQAQIQQLQQEVKELGLARVELSAQLAESAQERHDLKVSLNDAKQADASSREEVDTLMRRLVEEKEFYSTRLEALRTELEHLKNRESQITQEMTRRMRKQQAEYEAELQAVKIELQEERSSARSGKKQQENLKTELERLHTELVRSQEDMEDLTRKYHKAKEEVLSSTQFTEDGLSKAKEVELELLALQESKRRMQKDFENLLYSVGSEVDSAIEVASMDSLETYKAVSLAKVSPSEPQKWLAEVKSKVSWLKNEIREKRHNEHRLRTDVRDAVETSQKDCEFLITELSRHHDMLDHVSYHHRDPAERDLGSAEKDLPLTDTFDGLGSNVMTEKDIHVSRLSPEPVQDTNSLLADTQREREKIHERYAKLQEAVSSLRLELSANKKNKFVYSNSSDREEPIQTHVRIASPPTQDFVSPLGYSLNNSSSENKTTPPPLALSDHEFAERFLLKESAPVDDSLL